jgi:hypothetical protein
MSSQPAANSPESSQRIKKSTLCTNRTPSCFGNVENGILLFSVPSIHQFSFKSVSEGGLSF